MTRAVQQAATRRGAFTACVLLLLALSLQPARWSGWLSGLSEIARLVVAPVQQPVYRLARWLAPGAGTRADDEVLAQIRQERERFEALWLRERERTAELERKIQEFQQGLAYTEIPVRQVAATVIGHSSEGGGGGIVVRAGSGQGVEVNNVVTAGGVQVVGRVARVGVRQCEVRLITDQATRQVRGVVVRDDGALGPVCSLYPRRSGDALQGAVEYRSGEAPVEIGNTVRLLDDQWPRSAAMLVLGRVESVESVAGGRQVILVKPTLDLQRLSEVILRTNPPDEQPPAAPAAGGGGGAGGRP